MKGLNKFKSSPDNHDFMEKDHIARFLRNHKTGADNLGRRALASIIAQYPGGTVVDAACGTCVNWEVFREMAVPCSYIGVDRSKDFLAHAKELYGDEIEVREGYVQELPFEDDEVDVVVMRHIVEHLQEGYEDAIREGLRVAEKELVLIFFLEPSNKDEDEVIESEPDENGCTYFWNTYSYTKLVTFLSQFGYQVTYGQVATPGAAHVDTILRIKK